MPPEDGPSGIHCRLDELLEERGMTLTRLAGLVGVSVVNLSILKNDRARAIRYSTLRAICDALRCEIGELLVLDPRGLPERVIEGTSAPERGPR